MSDEALLLDGGALAAQLAKEEAERFAADQARIAKLPHRNVNGVLVAMTAKEIAEHEADGAANRAARDARPKPFTVADLMKRIESLEQQVAGKGDPVK